MNNYTRLNCLRHGKLATPGVFCAPADAPLSQQGWDDLNDATANGAWDIIISSPQHRCLKFAEALASQQSCSLLVDDNFKEMDFGLWTGKTREFLWENEPEKFQQLWQSPDTFQAPEGESMISFVKRVKSGLDQLLAKHENQSILLVTHGGVIRVLLAQALNITHNSALKLIINHACLSQLHYYSDGECSLFSHLNPVDQNHEGRDR